MQTTFKQRISDPARSEWEKLEATCASIPPKIHEVVILGGGKGARLREETELRPKPILLIGERPLLYHIMKIDAAQGHQESVLDLSYRP